MIRRVKRFINDPAAYFWSLVDRGFLNWVPDEIYLKVLFFCKTHKKLNLKNPITFPDKLNWLKLHDRNPKYVKLVDKYKATSVIADLAGEEYVIPVLGVWESFNEIDFNGLPDRFVLKASNDSGSVYICRDKNKADFSKAKKVLERGLKRNYLWHAREWPYKMVHPCIIAEEYLEETDENDAEKCLTDYKFFCFNGEPRIVYVSKDNAEDPTTDFFDMDFNHLPIIIRDKPANIQPQKPPGFEEMKEVARKLSSGIPHIRVDCYQVNGRVYVGEFTFYHLGGMAEVKPEEWNVRLGDWIPLVRSK